MKLGGHRLKSVPLGDFGGIGFSLCLLSASASLSYRAGS